MSKHLWENIVYVVRDEWMRYAKIGFGLVSVVFGITFLYGAVAGRTSTEVGALAGEFDPRVAVTASIDVPAIGVQAPIVFVNSVEPIDYLQPLKEGVAHYPSVLPGENGLSVLLGHSSPFGLGGPYDGIFTDISSLRSGDAIHVTVNGTRHRYVVTETFLLQAGQVLPQQIENTDRASLVLISCWPPGIDNKRMVAHAVLKD